MVYKRYIKRDGKTFGPYYYESYRDKNGVSKTRLVSAPKIKSKTIFFLFLGIFLILLVLFLFSFQKFKAESSSTDSKDISGKIEQSKFNFFSSIKNIITGKSVDETPAESSQTLPEPSSEQSSDTVDASSGPSQAETETPVETAEQPVTETPIATDQETTTPNENLSSEATPNEEINNSSTEIMQNESSSQNNITNEENNSVQNESLPEINQTEETILNETNNTVQIIEKNLTQIIPENETNQTFEENITITIADELSKISTKQYNAIIGKPVKWEKEIRVDVPNETVSNLELELPSSSGNITVNKIDSKTGEETNIETSIQNEAVVKDIDPIIEDNQKGNTINPFAFFLTLTGKVVNIVSSENQSVLVKIEEPVKDNDGFVVGYYTEPPYSKEDIISETEKDITVVGPDDVHYEKVLAFSKLPYEVSSKNNVKLSWKSNGSEIPVDFELIDYDNNSLYDYVSWIVPHLSEQDYNLQINVLNVQSYPVVGGMWNVDFSTVGKANLTIKAVDGTTWSNEDELNALKFISVKCGLNPVDYQWMDNSVFIENYECNSTSSESSKVLTEGNHKLEFTFGNQKAYAYNDASTSNIPQTLNLHGKLTDSNGNVVNGTQNMSFRIYDSYAGGNLLWESLNKNVSVDSLGIYHYVLTGVNLSFNAPTYLGIQIGSDNEMSPRINLTSTPYSFRADTADTLNTANNYQIQNLSLAQKITFGLGQIIDGVENGWLKITGNLNVTGNIVANNVTAQYFIGDGSLLTGISTSNQTNVSSNITFGMIIGSTSETHDGNLVNGTNIGYVAGNSICNLEFSGSHFCLESEVVKTITAGNYSYTGTQWMARGAPGYTANANDCNGWTSNSNTYLGPFWNWDGNAQAGYGALVNCAQTKSLMCCK